MNAKQKLFNERYSLKGKLHAINYGAELKLTEWEAKLMLDKYKKAYPGLDEVLKDIIKPSKE